MKLCLLQPGAAFTAFGLRFELISHAPPMSFAWREARNCERLALKPNGECQHRQGECEEGFASTTEVELYPPPQQPILAPNPSSA